jgi:hypothetical protein
VPYVQACTADGRCRGPFVHFPRLFLSDDLPVRLGHAYGLRKELVRGYVSVNGRQTIGGPIGGPGMPMADATWRSTGAHVAPELLANVAPISNMLQSQYLVGVSASSDLDDVGASAALTCCRFDWGLDTRATVAPAEGTVRLHPGYGAPFANGLTASFRGIDGADGGAYGTEVSSATGGGFVLKTRWQMGPPIPCELLPASTSRPSRHVLYSYWITGSFDVRWWRALRGTPFSAVHLAAPCSLLIAMLGTAALLIRGAARHSWLTRVCGAARLLALVAASVVGLAGLAGLAGYAVARAWLKRQHTAGHRVRLGGVAVSTVEEVSAASRPKRKHDPWSRMRE